MRCIQFEQMASAYLDEELSIAETNEYRAHLMICAACRTHSEELRQASSLFKELSTPETPRELRGYVMTSIERRVSGEMNLQLWTNELLVRLNPKPVAYATGFVLSVIMFAFTLSGFRPIPVAARSGASQELSAYLLAGPPPIISSDQAEFNRYNDLPATASANDQDYYELPYLNDSNASISFSNIAYQKAGDERMTVLINVGQDGCARLESVIDEPKDPVLVEQFWWLFGKRTFQPATVDGHPVSTNIVMFVEKMDVDGDAR